MPRGEADPIPSVSLGFPQHSHWKGVWEDQLPTGSAELKRNLI